MRRIGVFATAVLMVACSAGTALDGDDSGSEVRVASGNTIEVTLESNASTGYRWVIAEGSPEFLTLVEAGYEEPDTDRVGAPGEQVFVFSANDGGAGILRLEYVRPFDDPIIPERVVEFIVIVDGAEWPPRDGQPPGTSSVSATGTQP